MYIWKMFNSFDKIPNMLTTKQLNSVTYSSFSNYVYVITNTFNIRPFTNQLN